MPTRSEPTCFETPEAFRRWLARHAATAGELIVGFHKVGSGQPSMGWSSSVDEALCFGWIDGVRQRIDDKRYRIRFSPRRPGSIWSAVNLAKVERLRADGRMTPAGEAAFAQRRADRSAVYAYEQAEAATLSDAETRLFRRQTTAWHYWQACPPGYRKQMLHHIATARRAETRAARLARLMVACAAGERLA